ncbi:MAG: response regulator [Deltaproteobacteria bacterium]|nr:response regulator [Deltaproteobacteria bacterium]
MSRILVVEDDEAIRKMEERILVEAGHQVDLCVDVAGARIRLAAPNLPDLVVLDLMMPGDSGLDLSREMRADPRLEKIPVVVVTARTGAEAMRAGFDAGATHYLSKPFTKQKLLEIVELALGESE